MSPEVLQEQGYSVSADVYSFAILMHEVYTTTNPFSTFDFHKPWRVFVFCLFVFSSQKIFSIITEIAEHVIKGGRMDIPDSCPEAFAELIKRCWAQNPSERPTFQDALLVLDGIYVPLAREK